VALPMWSHERNANQGVQRRRQRDQQADGRIVQTEFGLDLIESGEIVLQAANAITKAEDSEDSYVSDTHRHREELAMTGHDSRS